MSVTAPSAAAPSPPPSKARDRHMHAWLYNSEKNRLEVALGENFELFTKYSHKKLRALVESENYRETPKDNVELFYAAQLLHYGLPPANGVEEAVKTIKVAFANLQENEPLLPPDTVNNLKEALKAEYTDTQRRGQEARIAAIQKELEEIEAVKQRGEQLRLELEALKPDGEVPSRAPKERAKTSDEKANQPPATPAPSAEKKVVPQQSVVKQREKATVSDVPDFAALARIEKRGREQHDGSETDSIKKSKQNKPTEQDTSQTTPEWRGLRSSFWGKWILTGEQLSSNCHAWLGVGKQYDHKGRRSTAGPSKIKGYIGKIEVEGLSALIVVRDVGTSSQMIGTSLQVAFTWITLPKNRDEMPLEGKLDVFFNGSTVDGYMSGGPFTKILAFEGAKEAGILTHSVMERQSKLWWDGLSHAENARHAASRTSQGDPALSAEQDKTGKKQKEESQ